ncbi:MFS transporter [Kutzneria kofuensis]|uniref:MFS family permease n=1 Tax=Kutzneria kofuensis TaxID=103725 RepID=A0A7W9KLC3_9PSEU|nr:MFS transporter [Kutzneria kofuensis]MBB5894660.1 MFS family permease [Kutzneria kofuensis]
MSARVAPAVRRAVWLSYTFQFFFGLLLWLPVFYEYQRQIGLSDEQIFGIQSIYYIAFCLLEIPTGMVADRFDYRHCLVAGGVVLIAANLTPVFLASYTGFLVHFLLIALARSLVSGAASAYLYEYMHSAGAGEAYPQAEGYGRSYSLIGKVVCWPVVGLLMQWNMPSPYWLSACNAAIAVFAAVALPAIPGRSAASAASPGHSAAQSTNPGHQGHSAAPPTDPVRPGHSAALPVNPDPSDRLTASNAPGGSDDPAPDQSGRPARPPISVALRGAFAQMRSSRLLVLLMVQGVAIFTLARICSVNLFQPILDSKNTPVVLYGVVMALMTVFEALGAARPNWLRNRISDVRSVFLLTVAMAVTLALAGLLGIAGSVIALCVFSLACGLSFPIQRALLNAAITDSRYRATLLSIESIIDRAVCALVALALGSYLAAGNLTGFLVQTAIVTCVVMVVIGILIKAVRRRTEATTAA